MKGLLLLAVLPACLPVSPPSQQQVKEPFVYSTPTSQFVVRNFFQRTIDWKRPEGIIDFSGEGMPAEWDQLETGASLTAPKIALRGRASPSGAYFLEKADAEGGADFILDSQRTAAFAKEKHLPPSAPIERRTELKSENLHYLGFISEGTMQVPGSLTIDSRQRGTQAESKSDPKLGSYRYEDVSSIEATSGVIAFSLATQAEPAKIKTGDLKGPVHYHLVHTEWHTNEAKPRVTTYDLKADRLNADFTKPVGTLTADGNVRFHTAVEGASPMTMDTMEDQAVMTFDAMGQFLEAHLHSGKPAKTTISGIGGGE